MSEIPLAEYEYIDTLDPKRFPKDSFLNWEGFVSRKRTDLFGNSKDTVQALKSFLHHYHNVQVIRGADFQDPFGDNGDFFLGNLERAARFAVESYGGVRGHPILVVVTLNDLLKDHIANVVWVVEKPGTLERLLHDGVINISPNISPNNIPGLSIYKPPLTVPRMRTTV